MIPDLNPMLEIGVSLDALATFREAASAPDCDVAAAAILAELAGADFVRIGLREELKPVSQSELQHLRRATRRLEVRIPAAQALLKPVLETQPDRVAIAAPAWDREVGSGPIDFRLGDAGVASVMRGLDDARVPVTLVVAPDLDSIKAAHNLGAHGVELFTGALVDLPPRERAEQTQSLVDAAMLARKLKLSVSLGGGLAPTNVRSLLAALPGAQRLVFGRSLCARATLVGIDRAMRDFAALVR